MRTTMTPAQFATFDPDFSLNQAVVSVEVVLGAAKAASRHVARGHVPCVVYPRTHHAILGSGAHPGFVVGYALSALRQVFPADEVYFAAGANPGTLRDRDKEGAPLCAACHAAGGGRRVAKRQSHRSRPCWSCVQMIEETAAAQEEA